MVYAQFFLSFFFLFSLSVFSSSELLHLFYFIQTITSIITEKTRTHTVEIYFSLYLSLSLSLSLFIPSAVLFFLAHYLLIPSDFYPPFIVAEGSKDFCNWESFKAQCGPEEVVVMEQATYGRMKAGKCIERDYGYVGCQADVLVHADKRCSGEREREEGRERE